jgi:hypothetical protein
VIGALVAVLAAAPLWDRAFTVERAGEVAATVRARCGGCSWSSPERPAAVLVLDLDGRYSQHLILTRGEGPAEYRVLLGGLTGGPHRLHARVDRTWTPRAVQDVAIDDVSFTVTPADAPEHRALALAPLVHVRANAFHRFTDVPLVMWYETDATPRGTRIRYSVIFSNEDGGTPADRLMATWGRLTDIEYVLGIEFAPDGRVLEAAYQGPEHKIVPVHGLAPGRHPALWVVTDNNMVADRGKTKAVFTLVPQPFDLTGTSREAVMDANPWTYQTSSLEAVREGRVREDARPGSRMLPDPRRFVYLEACAQTSDAALTFGVAFDKGGALEWADSDGGQKEFRIIRRATEFPNGCFRGAVALGADAADAPLRALRFRAYTRAPGKGEAPLPPGTGSARVLRVNRLFRLDRDDLPGPDLFTWTGELPLAVDGPPAEIPIPGR